MKNKNSIDETKLYAQDGYPLYPQKNEVIITPYIEEDVKLQDVTKEKSELNYDGSLETDFNLDVPGAELDDANEAIGNEDEENNYYSVGGDRHNDLEEDKN